MSDIVTLLTLLIFAGKKAQEYIEAGQGLTDEQRAALEAETNRLNTEWEDRINGA